MSKENADKLRELEGLASLVTRLRNADPGMRSQWSGLLYKIWQFQSQIGEGCTPEELEDAYHHPVYTGFEIHMGDMQFAPASIEGDKVRMKLDVEYKIKTYKYTKGEA